MRRDDSVDFQGTERFGILRRIGAGGMGVVYEAYDRERGSLVALKTLREASPETIFQFKQEFRFLAKFVHPNLVPLYEFISDGEQWFFTMELLQDAVDLKSFLDPDEGPVGSGRGMADSSPPAAEDYTEDETIDAPEVDGPWDGAAGQMDGARADRPRPRAYRRTFDRARIGEAFGQLAEGVIALHEARILHRDLKPANVMVREKGEVVLLDFGLVQELITEASAAVRGGRSDDSSGHDAAESSGRITGSVAYMAPEQAAGQALTEASDWYSVGVMLYEVLTGRLPFTGTLTEILHQKQHLDPPPPQTYVTNVPEDLAALCMELLIRDPARRPQGAEVVARLEGREALGEGTGAVSAPPMTTPFVGRERHLGVLARCFERAAGGGVGVCRVEGLSGAGKSALVEHFLEGLTARRDAVVLVGRCYEQESMPYKAVDSLLDALTRHLLNLSTAELDAVIPEHAAALTRVFPALRRIDRFAALAAGGESSGNLEELRMRAFGALGEMLTRMAERRPVVLSIDDLQWGDLDSAALIREILCSVAPPRLLMVFCYRTEYVGVSPCLEALDGLTGDGDPPLFRETLEVDALTAGETRDLAMTLIGQDSPEADVQADWVVGESGGSALFIYELVQHLKAGMERFEAGDLHLDEVLWRRVQRLPEQHRALLEVVAVASRPILLRHVQEVARLRAIPPQLIGALRSERLVRTTGPGLEDDIECYHDRIRESIVANLPESVVAGHHAALAACLERDGDAKPDLLAGHLEGAGQLRRAGEFYRLAAGQAVETLAFDRAEEFYQRALAYAVDDSTKAEVLERLVHFYTDLARFGEAYRAGREGARLFGIHLPPKFHPLSFFRDLIGARLRLGRRGVADILELPEMSDERLAGAVRLIAAAAKAAYQLRPELCVAINARMVNLCLKHGNSADSAIGYMVFGCIFLGGILGNYRRGFEFGRLSLDLVEKYENVRQKAEVNFVVGYFGTSWLRPVLEAEELWRVAYASGLETGDLFHTGCACCATTLSYFMRGAPMDEILKASDEYLELLQQVGLDEPGGAVLAVRQAVKNLQGRTRSRVDFTDHSFDEREFVGQLATYGSRHFAHYYFVVKMQTSYLWGDLESALDAAEAARGYLKDSTGMLHSAEHRFYHALIIAGALTRSGSLQRRVSLSTLRRLHRLLRRWAAQCPHNFLHRERLIAGELARISGGGARAEGLYLEARRAAAMSGHPHIEALAHRLVSESMRDRDPLEAERHLRLACDLYRRWGATRYAEALENGTIAKENQS